MRILLAGEDAALAKALIVLLKSHHYGVESVRSGVDALHYLESGGYDAAILDVATPGLDGIALVRRLRGAGNPIPILLLSACGEIEEKVRGLDSGANDYLTKPFDNRELLARLRAMTRTYRGPDPVLTFGNVRLDPVSCTLSTPAGHCRLANKEYQIMEILMAQPSRILSTERLMEKIWGLNTETEISVVWVYLSGLRRKLKALRANIRIVCSRNAGYHLEEISESTSAAPEA